jgi:two-component system, chemotaxis family, CheB/CheR fusion protein
MSKARKQSKRPVAKARSPRPSAPPPAPVVSAPEPIVDHDTSLNRSKLPEGIMIVGVGASAGGLEAFTELLQHAPDDAGLTFVFIQHLSPNHVSGLQALLSPHTSMPVIEVLDGVHVQPNHLYVIPPNVRMTMTGDTLQLRPRGEDRRLPTPIDAFFQSMAEIACDRGVGIVLSGTGSDGALGLRDLKGCGGITFAQLPASAKFDGMPRAAIATGMVDLVMTPAQIGAELSQIAAHPYVSLDATDQPEDAGNQQLLKIFELLRPASGVDFTHYKQPTIRRRLLRSMALHRLNDLGQYVKLLQSDPQELQGLFQDLLIHVTRFFREPESFQALVEQVFPKLIEGRDSEHTIRVWVCGCATGEEAYSVAIELTEFLHRENSQVRAQVFATDVSEPAIEHARAGLYAATIAGDVPPDLLRRYFTRTDGHYRVIRQIRDMCVFARQDLTKDPPFSRLDIVMCRNVLIYMDTVLQRRLLGLFHYALLPNSFLVLGQAETVGTQASLFSMIDKKHRIHRKKALPGAAALMLQPGSSYPKATQRRPAPPMMERQSGLQDEVSRLILERYSPPGVVVDAELQIVQFRGHTGPFLEPAPGDATLSLLKMVREGLLYGVRSAIDEARKSRHVVRREDLQVRIDNKWVRVGVEVVPLASTGRAHYLVMFDRAEHAEKGKSSAKTAAAGKGKRTAAATPARMTSLQRELDASREYLQSIIQELEAANEELQSANEEILSSNEELQSTNEELDTAKEELQSTNEELNTVNDELQGRNDELSRVNSDLLNLVGSVNIAIVIVGSDLRIRRFTAMAEKTLNLIPADLNRSIAHINPNIDCHDLPQLIIECMDSVTPIEREVRDRQGRWFSLRIRPYKSVDNKIDGAVVSLFDIDLLKRSAESTQRAQLFADALLDESSEPVALVESDFKVNKVNRAFAELFGMRAAEFVGRSIPDVGGDGWALTAWRDNANRFTPGEALPPINLQHRDRRLTVNARAVPAPDSPDATLLMVSVTDGSPR